MRAQDAVWLLLFSALAWVSPYHTEPEIAVLVLLAALQTFERRIGLFASRRGNAIAISLKLALCYLLIGWTDGISSTYYLILLLPVVSAATTMALPGTAAVTALACLGYLSFLLYLDWSVWELDPRGIGELGLRVIFLPVVAFLTYQLAEANRIEAQKYQILSQQFAETNRNLQEAEAAVRRSERLAALGQLSAGLAHELRNPLGTVRASAEMLSRQLSPGNTVSTELAGYISSEVDRANSLITRFLDFARPMHLRLAAVSIAEVLDRAILHLEQNDPRLTVSVHRNYDPGIPPIALDPELMESVFYNLIRNAAEATSDGGSITVKTRSADAGVEISVIDRGRGIAPEDAENIFNPFFTTKPDGVGLGLAIVSKIVDEHRGTVTAASQPGEGSVFRVSLPYSGPDPLAPRGAAVV